MLMISLGDPDVWLRMWYTHQVRAPLMGHASVLEVSWLMMLPWVPFFWLVMHMVILAAVYRVERLAVLGMMVWLVE